MPTLSPADIKEFTAARAYWWQRYTDYQSFCTHTEHTHRDFHFQVETDGISVSILMFQPTSGSTSVSAPPVASKKRKRRQQQQATSAWVSGMPDSQLLQAPRIVGLDPGRKALFTAVVHSQQAADSLQRGAHARASMTLCHGAAVGGKRPAVSSTGCASLSCG